MGVFSAGGIGIDLGSENTVVALEDEGVALREPTSVLTSLENENEVLAVGLDAKRMAGRTDPESYLQEPVQYGGVANSELAAMCLLSASEKATQRRRPFEKNRLAVTCPHGATRVERKALSDAIILAGGKKSIMIKSTVAAAIGSGLRIDRAQGVMMISVGAQTTEISILSANGIAASRAMKTGSRAFDEAIVRYVRREKGLVIGATTADHLKRDIGSAVKPESITDQLMLRGRHVLSGKPSTETVTALDVFQAIDEPVRALVESISDALYNVPAELAGDILEGGIHLTGGGSMLMGLSERLHAETQLKVTKSASPMNDAALGALRVACDERLARQLLLSASAFEVL